MLCSLKEQDPAVESITARTADLISILESFSTSNRQVLRVLDRHLPSHTILIDPTTRLCTPHHQHLITGTS
jgi:hypothetical protein